MTVHKTKGIVLRTVKYGETSVIVSILTELFGVQSYLVNGVRASSKRGSARANYFQPGAILDLVVYHNDLKNLQRIKEFRWSTIYQHIFFNVVKNAVALFMVELLQKTLKQPEVNPDLFHFIEDAFLHLDQADDQEVGNYPLFFALHLTTFYGARFSDEYTERNHYLDLQEGEFTHEHPVHPYFLDGQYSYVTSQLLKVMQPHELKEIRLNQEMRRVLLQAYQTFYALHFPDFGLMKTLPVLQEVLS
ncbi:MAG: DNA repair protein RecO [Candidatus Pseudobacter hemicellulosilyticus]|uniref:DNA repair protein RecO n=1 Tax=Candidatus Pseudobacter hemicellulosilyticus TaxID=3121375 RepID=A0AAJ5WUD8_9BACT|nr:MAG: DNA repair protein RecO [Pseudobacter sp.]